MQIHLSHASNSSAAKRNFGHKSRALRGKLDGFSRCFINAQNEECSASDQIRPTYEWLYACWTLFLEHKMHPIIYDVAVSIDGFISGPDGDVSQFAQDGPVVEAYFARLARYATAIMGRETYEFGLKPGENPYKSMETLVFSRSMDLQGADEISVQKAISAGLFRDLKARAKGPIYLCGGGDFAGSLLDLGVIDILRLKRAPILLGGGVALFGSSATAPKLKLTESQSYENGYVYQEFAVLPN
jgi:dihydrofolate reductase